MRKAQFSHLIPYACFGASLIALWVMPGAVLDSPPESEPAHWAADGPYANPSVWLEAQKPSFYQQASSSGGPSPGVKNRRRDDNDSGNGDGASNSDSSAGPDSDQQQEPPNEGGGANVPQRQNADPRIPPKPNRPIGLPPIRESDWPEPTIQNPLRQENQTPLKTQGQWGNQPPQQQNQQWGNQGNAPAFQNHNANGQPNTEPIISPDQVDHFQTNRPPDGHFSGTVKTVEGKPQLQSGFVAFNNGTREALGEPIASGSFADTYTSVRGPNFVTKVVYLKNERSRKILIDQGTGRKILHNVQSRMPESDRGLFHVARQNGTSQLVQGKDDANKQHNFALAVEENIASPVQRPDGSTAMVTNARMRIKERGDISLTTQEEATINLVIRHLNSQGVVWSDHKLENLDVVPSRQSPTGYQVVFFDFDGFRPVKGDTLGKRQQVAREVQKTYDQPSEHMGELLEKMSTVNQSQYGNRNPRHAIDYQAAFGDLQIDEPVTYGSNKDRTYYLQINEMNTPEFNAWISSGGGQINPVPGV